MRAFVGVRPNKHDINHKDQNTDNNRLSNLEYVDQSNNRSTNGSGGFDDDEVPF